MDKYRVDDVVRVRKDLTEHKLYGAEGKTEYAVDDMIALAGKDVEIVGIRDGYYRVKDCWSYNWTEDMFQGLVKPRYKVGDKVIVRKDLVVDDEYGIDLEGAQCYFVHEMAKYRGKPVTIRRSDCSNNLRYGIEEDGGVWSWTDDMFVGPAPKEKSEDKTEDNAEDKGEYAGWSGVNDLRVGDKVRFRTDMKWGTYYGNLSWLDGMQEYAGRPCTVSNVYVNGDVRLKEDLDVVHWYFSPEMFHEVWRDGVKLGGNAKEGAAAKENAADTGVEKEVDCSESENFFFSGKLVCTDSDDDAVIEEGQVVIVDNGEFTWSHFHFHHVFSVSAVVWAFNKAFDTEVEFVKLREAH